MKTKPFSLSPSNKIECQAIDKVRRIDTFFDVFHLHKLWLTFDFVRKFLVLCFGQFN